MKAAGRTLHLIDIENQLGHGHISSVAVSAFMASYKELVGLQEPDQTILAVSSSEGLVELAASNVDRSRLLYRHGKDGADHELQDVMLLENIAERFDSVILASGDGGFVDAVFYLVERGVHVTVIAPAGSMSKRLRLVAHETIEISSDSHERLAA